MFSVDFWSSETGIIHEPLLFQSLDFLNKMFPTVLNVLCFPEEQTFFNTIVNKHKTQKRIWEPQTENGLNELLK